MRKNTATAYKNGSVIRRDNLRVSITAETKFKDGIGNLITITKMHTESRDKVLCRTEILRGKYVVSQIALTDDALDALLSLLYIERQRRIDIINYQTNPQGGGGE